MVCASLSNLLTDRQSRQKMTQQGALSTHAMDLVIGLCVLLGILFFLVLEKTMRFLEAKEEERELSQVWWYQARISLPMSVRLSVCVYVYVSLSICMYLSACLC